MKLWTDSTTLLLACECLHLYGDVLLALTFIPVPNYHVHNVRRTVS